MASSLTTRVRRRPGLCAWVMALSLCGCGQANTGKAREFMDAHMYPQAIALLEEETQIHPRNAEAHLLLGECRLVTGDTALAEEAFGRATVLVPSIGSEVGKVVVSALRVTLRDRQWPRAFELVALAMRYDPKASLPAAEALVDAAGQQFAAREFDNGIALARHALAVDSASRTLVSTLLVKTLSDGLKGAGSALPPRELATLAVQADGANARAVGQLYLTHGKALMGSGPSAVGAAIADGFDVATQVDPSTRTVAAAQLYAYAERALAESRLSNASEAAHAAGRYDRDTIPKATGLLLTVAEEAYGRGDKVAFREAFGRALSIDAGVATATTEKERCLHGLFLYETGQRVEAIGLLRDLEGSADPFVGRVTKEILSPPRVGRHAVRLSTAWTDLGWTGPMTVTLTDYDVTPDRTIVLHLVLRNDADKANKLMYGYRGEDEYLPYILDDNGQKARPLVSFEGGRQEPGNGLGRCRNILLNRSESVEVSIRFPITSLGASTFDLMSPRLNGWQWEWSIKGIPLH